MSGNILYISYDGMTDPLGQSQVLPYLSGLVRAGYRITLLSCEKPDRFERHGTQISALCRDAGIVWHPLGYTARPPVISTLQDIRRLTKTAARLHRTEQYDIVHCRSYISAIVGLSMKRRFGLKFLFDMRGFWADERVDGGLWKRSNPLYDRIYRYFKRKEREFLAEADAIISLTHAGKEEIGSWPVRTGGEITVIPCCVDTDLFNPALLDEERQQALRLRLDIPSGRTVLGYVGSLGTWYLLPEMLAFFHTWQERDPGSILFFVTTEPEFMILAEAEKQGIPRESLRIVSAARSEMPGYIALMDYGVFFLKQAFSKKASSPVKQGELMAMGIPVICNAGVGDSDRIVSGYGAGILVPDYTENAYLTAAAAAAHTRFDAGAIRAGCLDYFDLEQGIAAYAAVYTRLMNPAAR